MVDIIPVIEEFIDDFVEPYGHVRAKMNENNVAHGIYACKYLEKDMNNCFLVDVMDEKTAMECLEAYMEYPDDLVKGVREMEKAYREDIIVDCYIYHDWKDSDDWKREIKNNIHDQLKKHFSI